MLVLAACQPRGLDGDVSGYPASDVPNLASGAFSFDFIVRGSVGSGFPEPRFPAWMTALEADEGEDCVTSWLTNFLGPLSGSIGGLLPFPAPVAPTTDMQYSLPDVVPQRNSPEDFYYPPVFEVDGTVFAWIGGVWTFTEWTSSRVHVQLVDGETCDYDLALFEAVASTCVPDEGTMTFDTSEGGGNLLRPLELGYRGEGLVAVDPRSGAQLCQRITTVPEISGN
jgi:hypothetical protein